MEKSPSNGRWYRLKEGIHTLSRDKLKGGKELKEDEWDDQVKKVIQRAKQNSVVETDEIRSILWTEHEQGPLIRKINHL